MNLHSYSLLLINFGCFATTPLESTIKKNWLLMINFGPFATTLQNQQTKKQSKKWKIQKQTEEQKLNHSPFLLPAPDKFWPICNATTGIPPGKRCFGLWINSYFLIFWKTYIPLHVKYDFPHTPHLISLVGNLSFRLVETHIPAGSQTLIARRLRGPDKAKDRPRMDSISAKTFSI